jgi:hypothetical protein
MNNTLMIAIAVWSFILLIVIAFSVMSIWTWRKYRIRTTREIERKQSQVVHRHIKGRYGIKKEKMIFACVIWCVSLVTFLSIAIVFLGPLYGILVSLAIWIRLAGGTLSLFLLSVPKVAGLVTTNWLSGYIESYGTGIHFKYPWEQVEDDHYISIRLVAENYGEDFPAHDGPKVVLKWTIQYRPTIEKLFMYISVDETKIREGFEAIGNSYLSDRIAIESAVRAREKVVQLQDGMKTLFEKTPVDIREIDRQMFDGKIKGLTEKIKGNEEEGIDGLDKQIENLLKELEKMPSDEEMSKELRAEKETRVLAFKNLLKERTDAEKIIKIAKDRLGEVERKIESYYKEKKDREAKGLRTKTLDECILEEEYGIDLVVVSLADTNYEDRYQDIRATDQMTQEIDDMLDRMIERSKATGKPMTREKAYNNVLILNKSASKDIVETEGEGGDALASLIMGSLRPKSEQSKRLIERSG